MVSIQNRDYGPRTEAFDPETRVWTVYFRRDGEPAATSEEELIFNFYGWEPAISPSSVAKAFVNRRDNVQILGKFEAPDELTKAPAYFIVSEHLYAADREAYINISKISSVGTGAYTVTFSKKITGPQLDEECKAWYLSPEGKAISRAVSHVGVDSTWQEYLSNKK